jgi:hypothetical protein
MQINVHDWRLAHPSAEAQTASPLPVYRLPPGMIARAAFAAARHRSRDIWKDALRLTDGMHPQPDVAGIEHIPVSGPCVIVPNHYERTGGVWVGWGAIVISAALARQRPGTPPINWVMTNTWTDCYVGRWRVAPDYLAWVLRGLASVYGLILMPAHDLPNHDTERLASGLALREVFRDLGHGHVVAFHPEAGGFQTMIRPPRGSGRVLVELDRRGIPCIPAGVFERDGRLTVLFGAALPRGFLAGLDDVQAADRVMREIACLVPAGVRGVYADDVVPAELTA